MKVQVGARVVIKNEMFIGKIGVIKEINRDTDMVTLQFESPHQGISETTLRKSQVKIYHAPYKIGDKVTITIKGDFLGKTGTIMRYFNDYNEYQINLDKKTRKVQKIILPTNEFEKIKALSDIQQIPTADEGKLNLKETETEDNENVDLNTIFNASGKLEVFKPFDRVRILSYKDPTNIVNTGVVLSDCHEKSEGIYMVSLDKCKDNKKTISIPSQYLQRY